MTVSSEDIFRVLAGYDDEEPPYDDHYAYEGDRYEPAVEEEDV